MASALSPDGFEPPALLFNGILRSVMEQAR